MQTVKVLLLDLKSDLPSPPFQLGLLASYAKTNPEVDANVSFTFSEHPSTDSAEHIARTVVAAEADLVAVSHYAWNHSQLCRTLDLLSSAGTNLPRIVLGGANCAGRFGATMLRRYPIISALVEGEGEPAFKDICESLADSPAKNPFLTARNTRFRSRTGEIIALNLGHRLSTLDEVPSPYLTGLLPTFPSPLLYETNRGCPYRCAFCYWGNGNSRINRMSDERVREEFIYFAREKVRAVFLADANFGIFESDVALAALIAEVNAQHGYPFKFVGMNYAKNSRDRVLDIATHFRTGTMFTSTTLALQSVTAEAEKLSQRYATTPKNFVHLVRSAHERGLSTYTDLILGMPGETIDEFMDGLAAVISTGIPAIKIHQLSVLPGTEFYDKQDEFGLVTVAQGEPHRANESTYSEFLVHSHPKMTQADVLRGLRIIAIHHILHNHNLCAIVNFYLMRYGVSPRDVYEFFDQLIVGQVDEWTEQDDRLLQAFRPIVTSFGHGRDAINGEVALSTEIWFGGKGPRSPANEPEISAFVHRFYTAFCAWRGLRMSDAELDLLREMIDYNVLVSPKPRWRPRPEYVFAHDVHQIWTDMLRVIHQCQSETPTGSWNERIADVSAAVSDLLTPTYLAEHQHPVRYRVTNPLPIFPELAWGWVVSNRDWFCRITPDAEVASAAPAFN